MPSDRRPAAGTQPQGAPVAGVGASPPYRSRVRSLLGMPAGEGSGPLFTSPLPPAGLTYAHDSLEDQPHLTDSPTSGEPVPFSGPGEAGETPPGRSSKAVQENRLAEATPSTEARPVAGPERVSVGPAASAEGETPSVGKSDTAIPAPGRDAPGAFGQRQERPAARESLPARPLPPPMDAPRPMAAELKPGPAAAEPVEEGEKPAPAVNEISLQIPGATQKSLVFPALTPATESEAPDEPEGYSSPVIGSRPEPDFARPPQTGVKSNIVTAAPAIRASKAEQEAEEDERSVAVMLTPRKLERPAAGDSGVFSRPVETAQAQELPPAPASPTVGPAERRDFSPGKASDVSAWPQSSPDVASQANRETADRIAQLRQAVQQLSARLATPPAVTHRADAHQGEAGDEPKQPPERPPAAPPVRPLIVINRVSKQARTPAAFWERRYLARFHLRNLR